MSKPKNEKKKKVYEKPEVVDLSDELLAEGGPLACVIYGGSATGSCVIGASAT